MTDAAWTLLVLAGVLAALPLVVYPAALGAFAGARTAPEPPCPRACHASVIVAFTGGGPLLRAKVANLAQLAAASPEVTVDLILAGDGPIAEGDRADALRVAGDLPVTVCALDAPAGKAHALNLAARHARGEVLIFSDLDAQLSDGALVALLRWFADPTVGAVCGRRRIVKRQATAVADEGQRAYTDLDSWIKLMENRLGAITSNDGKLYAVRRSLFQPIHPAASDDLYNALSVVDQGYRVLFEPTAAARIPAPAWTVGHDLARRRRVTLRSLTGIAARPRILAMARFAWFGPRLVVNKILRRLLPLDALLALLALLLLAPSHAGAAWLLGAGAAGAGLAAGYLPLARAGIAARLPVPIAKPWAAGCYASLGMLGMLLGVIDFLRGKRIARWAPRKTA